jgi:hypothetical protein
MDLTDLPVVELRVLYKVIYRQFGSNTPGAYFVEVDDYRRALSSATSTAAAVVDHGNLTGLGDDDHTQYLLVDGSRDAVELTVTGDLVVDTDTLFVDATNDRVGINTSSPGLELSVNGQIDMVGDARAIKFGRQDEGGPFGLEAHTSSGVEGALYYRTSPNSWSFEDGAGNKIAEFDTDDLSSTFGGALTASGGIDGLTLANGGISGSNYNITGVNQLEIADPGEGIVFKGGASGDYSMYIIDDASDKILQVGGVTNSRIRVNAPSGNAELELLTSGVRWALFANASDNSFNLYNTIGSTDFTFTTNGRLGINDTSPSYNLDVNGNIHATSQFIIDSSTDQQVILAATTTTGRPYMAFNHHDDSSYRRAGYVGYPEHNAAGAHMQMVADNGWVNFWAGGYGAGLRVGLPTGSYGTVETSGAGKGGWEGYSINGWVVFMANSSTGNFGIYNDQDNEWAIYCDFNGFVDLRYNGSWKARTASDGFEVAGHLYPDSDNSRQLGKSGRAWDHFWLQQANQFSSGGYWTLRSRDSDRQVMELVSSERYKKDIVDMPLEEAYQVLDARVIKYRGIDDADDTPLEAGLSAESLHEAGYEYAVRYDEGHWGETPRSIYYEYLTVPLIKIGQDQKNRVESLEAQVAALTARLEALEAQ